MFKLSASQYDKHNTIAFYSHKESTCMTTSFHQKVSFWPIKLVQPSTFHWNTCTNPGKWAVMYLCVKGIDFAFFYGVDS